MLSRTMPDFRAVVQAELDRRELSVYRLVQMLKGKRPKKKDVPPATVYAFLRGESTLNSADLGLIFDVLELDVKPKR